MTEKSITIKAEVSREDAINLYLDLISSLCNLNTIESVELIQEYVKRLRGLV